MYAKSLTLLALAALGVSATEQWSESAPPSQPPAHQAPPPPPPSMVHATFQGANPPVAQFEATIPGDGTPYPISNPLSISHIITDGGSCTFYGVDKLELHKDGAGPTDVGPPQTIVKAVCYADAAGYQQQQGGSGSGYKKAKRFSA
jgi:hypothetical protein